MKKFFLFAFATILALAGCCKQEQKQTAELDQPMSIITETEINQVVETVKTANRMWMLTDLQPALDVHQNFGLHKTEVNKIL